VFKREQVCNRCEKGDVINIFGPVENLGKGRGMFCWEGLPINRHTGRTESEAFLCPGCVFPACSRNQDHQDLEYQNGQFQATEASRSPRLLPTPVPAISETAKMMEPDQESAWGDSSDDSEFIPLIQCSIL
jgi:hypothetical protein